MNNSLTCLIFILIYLLSSISHVFAYVQSRTQADHQVQWPTSISLVDIFVNASNTQFLSQEEIHSIADSSISQWNGHSRILLRKNSTSGVNQNDLNEIYFSSDPSVFNGTGVVGITQVFYKNNTGEIVEADILLNDFFPFSLSSTDANYVGNVITHEAGHLIGLGHSQVIGSSMFYSLSRGQSQVSSDDKSGIYSIYPNSDSSKGSIRGTIMGGPALVGVFGAHVQAFSLKTGKIAASTISEINGNFSIQSLPINDSYFLYVSPLQLIGLPSRFANARFDFCTSSTRYRGSFYQGCGTSKEGYPQALKLSTSELNVGNVSIRCSLDVPTDFIRAKNADPPSYDPQSFTEAGLGNTFTGYFSSTELNLGVADKFKIDFSNEDWDALSSGNLYLELKVSNQAFYSPYKSVVTVRDGLLNSYTDSAYKIETDGWLNIDNILRIPINKAIPSANIFEVSIKPESMTFPSFPVGLPETKADYFPASSSFEDSMSFYLVNATIVKEIGGGEYSLVSSKISTMSDNTKCPDAINTYALSDYSVKRNTASSSSKRSGADKGLIACGITSLDSDTSSGNGPGGFLVGICLVYLLSSIFKNIKSKLNSKLA